MVAEIRSLISYGGESFLEGGSFCVIEMFMYWVVIQVNTSVKAHLTEYLRSVHITVYKFNLKKPTI